MWQNAQFIVAAAMGNIANGSYLLAAMWKGSGLLAFVNFCQRPIYGRLRKMFPMAYIYWQLWKMFPMAYIY